MADASPANRRTPGALGCRPREAGIPSGPPAKEPPDKCPPKDESDAASGPAGRSPRTNAQPAPEGAAGGGPPASPQSGEPLSPGFLRGAFYRFSHFLVRNLFRLFPVRWHGAENVPLEGGCLLASNHQSFLDPPLVGICLRRQVHFMARSSLFRGLFGRLITALNAFPVDRDRADPNTFREAIRRLKDGAALLIFPEGTRSPDGSLKPLLPGVGMLALRAGVPVVPVYIHGAFRAWPRGRKMFRFFRPIYVFFGKPFDPAEAAGKGSSRERYENVARTIESRLREMEAEAHKLHPLLPPPPPAASNASR